MSRSPLLLFIATLLLAALAPVAAEAQFYPTFQKLTADDDDVDDGVTGFPPSHACPDPCDELHSILRIINCGAINPDGTCGVPNPQLTGGVVTDQLPTTLRLDCGRGVVVTGDGSSDPPVCDVATNTVTVSNISVDGGGTLDISFWATVECEDGIARNQASLQWDQNPNPGTLLMARDPAVAFGGSGLSIRVGDPMAVNITKDVPAIAISGMPAMRLAPPGSRQRWVIEGGNPSCDALTILEMQDVEEPRGCLEIDCSTLRMFINGIPTPIPAGTQCPEPTIPLSMVLGGFTLQPQDTFRLEYDAVFTGVGGPECCNYGDFSIMGTPNVQTSDPGLENMLMPEATCVMLGENPVPVFDAVKSAEDGSGGRITGIEPGQVVNWRFTMTNNSGTDGSADLNDTFPPLAILGPAGIVTPFPTGVCTITGQTIDCVGVVLNAGESAEMVVSTTIDCAAVGGDTICNVGTVNGPGGSGPTHCPGCPAMAPGNETCIQVLAPAFPFATKTGTDGDGDGVVSIGETITWTLNPLNSGTTDARGVVIRDTIPPGASYVPGSLALDGLALSDAADADAGEVVGAMITVRVGDVAPVSGLSIVTFETLVDSVAEPEICNDTAALSWAGAGRCPAGAFSFASACVPTTSAPSVSASKSVSPLGPALRGAILSYSVEACNDPAAAAATGILVEDLIAANATYVTGSLSLDGGALTDSADADVGQVVLGPPTRVSVAVGDLAPGECRTVNFDVAVNGDASGQVFNTGTVSGDGVPAFDTNRVATRIDVPNPAELSATKSVTPFGSVDPGATLSYSVSACNGEMAAMARNVVVVDNIPAETTYAPGTIAVDGAPRTDITDGDGSEFLAGPPARVSITLGDLDPDECRTATFDVVVDAGASGPILNTASVSSDTVPAFDTNQTSTPIGVIVDPPPVLSVVKSSVLLGMPPASVGEVLEYTLSACNAPGAGPAAGVVLSDLIPLDGATGCGGSYVPSSLTVDGVLQTDIADTDEGRFEAAPAPGRIVVDIDTLAPGECVEVVFEVMIEAGCDDMETVLNTARLTATGQAPLSSNTTRDVVGVIVSGDPALMRKEGFPLMNQCPNPPTMCGCEVGNRLDPVADDCLIAGTCSVIDPVSWLVAGDQITGGAMLVFYEIDGAGCRAAGDAEDLRVAKSGTDDIVVRLAP